METMDPAPRRPSETSVPARRMAMMPVEQDGAPEAAPTAAEAASGAEAQNTAAPKETEARDKRPRTEDGNGAAPKGTVRDRRQLRPPDVKRYTTTKRSKEK